MKKILLLFLGISLSFPLFSQEDLSEVKTSGDEYSLNTLFSKKPHKPDIQLGYFMEMNASYTQFGNKNVFLPGMNFGLIINHNWSLGLAASFTGNPGNLYFDDIYYTYLESGSSLTGANLFGGYGGVLFEYTAFPRSIVHFSVPVMIGAGYFSYIDDYYYGNDFTFNSYSWDYNTIDWNVCFIVEPGIKLEFNIVKMLRLGVSASYRYSPNFELVNTPTDLINQFTGRFSLRFGKF